MSKHRKGKVAEAAVLFRLLVHGFEVIGSPFDGDTVDWVAQTPDGRQVKIQVKWAGKQRQGLPLVGLQHHHGYYDIQRYQKGSFDYMVAYYTDTAYVWAWDELEHLNRAVTINPDAAERWGKLCQSGSKEEQRLRKP